MEKPIYDKTTKANNTWWLRIFKDENSKLLFVLWKDGVFYCSTNFKSHHVNSLFPDIPEDILLF